MNFVAVLLVCIIILTIISFAVIFNIIAKIKRKGDRLLHSAEGRIVREVVKAVANNPGQYQKSILEGVLNEDAPKSVSGMTKIYLPSIAKDYPNFNYNEMKRMVETFIYSYFKCFNENSTEPLEYGDEELRHKLENILVDNQGKSVQERYDSVKIHQTEIARYSNHPGKSIVTFQSSLEYNYTKKVNNVTAEGANGNKRQDRVEVELLHIQNRNNMHSDTVGYNCPNCGAPLAATGKLVCSYCGTGVEEYSVKVWVISDITQK